MAVTVDEKWTSRAVDRQPGPNNDSGTVEFIAIGSDDTTEIEAAIIAWLPPVSTSGLPLASYDFEQIGPEVWEGSATFTSTGGDPGGTGPAPSVVSFDTTGGTTDTTTSIERKQKKAKAGETAPGADVGDPGELNDGPDGPQPVQIVIPALQFSERHVQPASLWTGQYIRTLASLTGGVNAAQFGAFAPGEVLFMGATGSLTEGETEGPIDYRFAAHINQQGITIGDLEAVDKAGWEYLHVRRAVTVDENANPKRTTSKPVAVYVDQLYPLVDFGLLQLPL